MERLLVANRGEIARRILRTCRAMGIATVAVFSDPDHNAPFVAEADQAVPLGGATPADSYLRVDALVAAALRTGAEAVHPGYGFLAENAEFARSCEEAGLVFVGPSSGTIAAMGSKIEARRTMESAGVPILHGEAIAGLDAEEIGVAAERVGWPVLVKASAGGGGKGMRIVRDPHELHAAVGAARRESAAAFGDDTLFLERYVEEPRHVEVQVLGDTHGTVVHLFERECSIQRRHQKIIEETPSPAVDAGLREKMGAAAVAAARAVDYHSAGTVEFLLTPEGDFFFLEMNTRLQVEHAVTELVTGLDLVRLQILVAAGKPLPPEARAAAMSGHAIEARLYAEDPRHDFLPVTGTMHRFRFEDQPGLRVDTGVIDGSEVSVHYDPLLAKVLVHAPTREEAARALADALARAQLHGPPTNRELLVRILRHPEFLEGRTDTHFLDRHDPAELGAPLADEPTLRLHALAAALAAQAERRRSAAVLPSLPSGWRNNPSQLQGVAFDHDGTRVDVGYRFDRGGLIARVAGEEISGLEMGTCTPSLVELEADGVRRRYHTHHAAESWYVDGPLGSSRLRMLDRFPTAAEAIDPGSLLSPMPGKVTRVEVTEGDSVAGGQVLVIIEAMKMEHAVRSPHRGVVSALKVREGDQVESEQVLAVVEEPMSDER